MGAGADLLKSSSACETAAALLTAKSILGVLAAEGDALRSASEIDADVGVVALAVTASGINDVTEGEARIGNESMSSLSTAASGEVFNTAPNSCLHDSSLQANGILVKLFHGRWTLQTASNPNSK